MRIKEIHEITRSELQGYLGCEGLAYIFQAEDDPTGNALDAIGDDSVLQVHVYNINNKFGDEGTWSKEFTDGVARDMIFGVERLAKRLGFIEFINALEAQGWEKVN